MVLVNKDTLPTIELDLTARSSYKIGDHSISVYRLMNFSKYPVYNHVLEPNGPFNVETVKVDGGHKLKIDKDKMTMVTVYCDESNKMLLFETYYEDTSLRNEGTLIHRYHAKDKKTINGRTSSVGESTDYCWIEYMYGNNNTLDKSNVDSVLADYKNKGAPLNLIQASGTYFHVVKIHEHCDRYCGSGRIFSEKTLRETAITYEDLEAHNKETETGFVDFITTSKGMITAVVTGSVGGAAIGGTLIYMVTS
ncbi:hypothetical protein MACK_001163 [Theileria orientalis]|uniref:Uncharacterized protein n=1 Tax=Theileria orientalis TaxID=68886 RepID=A0A976MCJ9_THEOR|nr:hypothetical protein MACK_001163 [Theileria orientalis]